MMMRVLLFATVVAHITLPAGVAFSHATEGEGLHTFQPPQYDHGDPTTVCQETPQRCGLGVVLDEHYAGVDNCSADPYCLTRRIYHTGSQLSDYITVPDWPDGTPGDHTPTPDTTDDTAEPSTPPAPACLPRAPARIPPSPDQLDLSAGGIAVNPYHEQLTGLESWFWWEGEATRTWASPVAWGVAADCSVVPPPSPRTYEATLVELRWQVEDGRPATYVSTHPGSEQQPAVRHTYRTAGTWTVRVSCTWQGAWGEPVTVPCGERSLDTIEVRTRLTSD